MGWFDSKRGDLSSVFASTDLSLDDSDQAQAYDKVNSGSHEAEWSHELLGGAAAYEAAKAYEEHAAKNGTSGKLICAIHLN